MTTIWKINDESVCDYENKNESAIVIESAI